MVEIEAVSKRFISQQGKESRTLEVLKDVSLRVAPGEFVCLLGPSGCGKTTLIRIISKLLAADSGSVRIGGSTNYAPGVDVCMVFQSYGLYPWLSLLDNVALGLKWRGMPSAERREIARAKLGLVGLGSFAGVFPHQVSGGMQQRVAIARALASSPKVLLMDEPFAAVDAQTREDLQAELLRVWTESRNTILFVTHSIEEAAFLADRVVVMGRNPGHVAHLVTVDVPRPRAAHETRTNLAYLETVAHLRDLVREVSCVDEAAPH